MQKAHTEKKLKSKYEKNSSSRYSRQEVVIGKKAQVKLSKTTIAIVGLGALGSVAAELLARSGLGKILLIDRDIVEETNLQRQVLYSQEDVGRPKAQAAHSILKKINSSIHIESFITDLNHKNIEKIVRNVDIILDCTDNLYTRFLINDYAKKYAKPWIYAGCIGQEGSVALLAHHTACFACFTKEATGLDTCDTAGVLNTASAMTASLQVQLAIQYTVGNSQSAGSLHHLNLQTMSWSKLSIKKNPQCKTCKGAYGFLRGKKEPTTLQYQCSDLYQFFVNNIDFKTIQSKAAKLGTIRKGKGFVMFEGISVFENGRILIKAASPEEAQGLLARYVGH